MANSKDKKPNTDIKYLCCVCHDRDFGNDVALHFKERLETSVGKGYNVLMDWDKTIRKDKMEAFIDNAKLSKYCVFIFTKGCNRDGWFDYCWKQAEIIKQKSNLQVVTFSVEPFRESDFNIPLRNLNNPLQLKTNYKEENKNWSRIIDEINPTGVLTSKEIIREYPVISSNKLWRDFLYDQYATLGTSLDPVNIVDRLFAQGMVTTEEKEIFEPKPRTQKVHAILDIIVRKDRDGIVQFLKSVEEKEIHAFQKIQDKMPDRRYYDGIRDTTTYTEVENPKVVSKSTPEQEHASDSAIKSEPNKKPNKTEDHYSDSATNKPENKDQAGLGSPSAIGSKPNEKPNKTEDHYSDSATNKPENKKASETGDVTDSVTGNTDNKDQTTEVDVVSDVINPGTPTEVKDIAKCGQQYTTCFEDRFCDRCGKEYTKPTSCFCPRCGSKRS